MIPYSVAFIGESTVVAVAEFRAVRLRLLEEESLPFPLKCPRPTREVSEPVRVWFIDASIVAWDFALYNATWEILPGNGGAHHRWQSRFRDCPRYLLETLVCPAPRHCTGQHLYHLSYNN